MKAKDRKLPSSIKGTDKEKLKNIQKLSISQLIELYAYAEAIVETVREPLVILDKDLRVKSANKSFYNTFKTKKNDVEGKRIYDLNSKEWNIPELKKLLEDILPYNSHFNNFEVSHNFGRIGQKIMLLNARRIILENQKTELILLAIEDITERKTLERQKDDFSYIARHELKTPVTSLKIYTQTMMRQLERLGEAQVSTVPLYKMNQQINKLTDLIGDLLDVSKVGAGKLEFHEDSFDLQQSVKDVIDNIQPAEQKHTIELVGSIKKKVWGDKDRIEQVITNLITNAVKFSPEANKVVIHLSSNKNEANVTVEDFGVGINKQHANKIFNKFYRVNNPDEKTFPGLGLGLYISYQIIQRHGGKMHVESEKGKGSKFSFTVPYARS